MQGIISKIFFVKVGNEVENRKNNNKLVSFIKSGLSNLTDGINNMFEDEIRIEKPDEIANIVEKILDFNNQNQTFTKLLKKN